MISFHSGIQALRKFKVNSLNERINVLIPNLELIGTEFIHFIESNKKLNQANKKTLDKLLNYSPEVDLENSNYKITIAPRIGTISPWSSKATDICKLCGLSNISRLERGINYHFNRAISAHELETLLGLVMDKMTESHLKDNNDSYLLFNELIIAIDCATSELASVPASGSRTTEDSLAMAALASMALVARSS